MKKTLELLLSQRLFIGVVLLISLSASPLRRDSLSNYMVIWNVGQGQWVTAVREKECLHFDVGGEFFPWKKLKALCKARENKIFLSHWDWDHIGGLAKWPSWSSCLALPPSGKSSKRKMKMLERFSGCANTENVIQQWSPSNIKSLKDTNSASHVVEYQQFLMPGDSPRTQEKIWRTNSWIGKARVLVLGHHGSRTSTSTELLDNLPHLQMAVASARWARYHHPHAETESLLKQHHIALLRTEDWGNLWFEL
ncbi:ComEC/Rec2 family competence protein [Bdellovibrio svalbardensis]|uniref:Hydrolase n=1 Tax=Bdellovibrio svalbardensis TaxID=2972972 RepID=A0ABT6DGZ1_9BACT|nr:hydrolase [Bdellovibrio svalbardensis]MDG0816105.1 hydrolase [Bdellovibrio svalbardensis]